MPPQSCVHDKSASLWSESDLAHDQHESTKAILLTELAMAGLQSAAVPPASPAKISNRMKAQPHMPPAKPTALGRTRISPQYPNESIKTVPMRSFQNIAALVALPAALRMRLNSIICRGTVMLQST